MNEFIIPLITLVGLELILGIDNIIFISLLTGQLPKEKGHQLRYWGLGLAVVLRLLLLAFISWILKLDKTLFTVFDIEISGKGIILILGGLFLIWKSTREIYYKTEPATHTGNPGGRVANFRTLLIEIIMIDLVFSVDSIITAVGMVKELWIMYVAVIVGVVIMMVAAKSISEFINRHPSFKILALSFLIMIGIALLGEGLHFEIPKEYIYFSMAFSFIVNFIQVKTHTMPKSST